MKKIIAILLSFILCFNFAIGVSAEEITEPYEENFATQHHSYLMELINQWLELLNNIFNLIDVQTPESDNHVQTGDYEFSHKNKIIDNMQVYYVSCNKCMEDNLHSNSLYAPLNLPMARRIISITLLDNDICKVEGFPQDEEMKKWTWMITKKTNEKICVEFLTTSSEYYVSGYVPNFINAYSSDSEGSGITFHYVGKTYPSVTDSYKFIIATGNWSKGEFFPDYRVYETINFDYSHLLF